VALVVALQAAGLVLQQVELVEVVLVVVVVEVMVPKAPLLEQALALVLAKDLRALLTLLPLYRPPRAQTRVPKESLQELAHQPIRRTWPQCPLKQREQVLFLVLETQDGLLQSWAAGAPPEN